MENVLFKISFPAEFHAQTAVECAMQLHAQVAGRLDSIERIEIETQEAGVRIIDKTGPLANYADRDHCIQYMVAVPLIFGRLTADDYSDDVAADPRIDALRDKMTVKRKPAVHQGLLRSGQTLYRQLGAGVFHRRHADRQGLDRLPDRPSQASRAEGIPVLLGKFEAALRGHLPAPRRTGFWKPAATRNGSKECPCTSFSDCLPCKGARGRPSRG